MKIDPLLNDGVILEEIGRRLAKRRVDLAHTQADLAEQAGIAKRTVERAEAGHPTKMDNMIRILRVLGWLENLDRLLPETGLSPMDLLKLKGKERQRASGKRTRPTEPWSWNDER